MFSYQSVTLPCKLDETSSLLVGSDLYAINRWVVNSCMKRKDVTCTVESDFGLAEIAMKCGQSEALLLYWEGAQHEKGEQIKLLFS